MKRLRTKSISACVFSKLLLSLAALPVRADETNPAPIACQELRRYDAPEATQAAAVDENYFYAIGDRVIAMYSKKSGRVLTRWTATADSPIVHLNSGVVREGKLYCAHSNFPNYPETSSVEIWDITRLRHVESHSFGIEQGSLTWLDWRDGAWWAVFAHYTEKVNDNPLARDARWTSLVKFDKDWRRTAGWVFPAAVVERFQPHSCSGGGWGLGGRLFCTGHDRGELYELALPLAGSSLKLVSTYAAPITGQGFAWDPSEPGVFYGIDRPKRQVVVVRAPETTIVAGSTSTPPAQPR